MSSEMASDRFASPMEKYVQFNFQRPDHTDAMLKILEDKTGEQPQIVVLSGEPGIGRQYFLEAVGYLAQMKGVKAHVAPIDLDGYANDGTSLEEYANHLLAKHTERERSKVREIIKATQLELKAKAQFWTCAFLSLEASLKIPLRKFWESMHDLSGPSRPGYEMLDRLISYLTQDAKLVMHIRDNDVLTTTWRRWLWGCLGRHRNLVLAFSSDSVHDFQRTDANIKCLSFAFGPHDRRTFRSIIDSRFGPNAFPNGFYAVLWRYSSGYPEDMARAVGDLVRESLVLWDGECWRLADESLESERFAAVFAADFYEPFDVLREQFSSRLMDQLDRFMRLAAICGSYVPSNLIMEFMGLSPGERDALGDLIDDRLVENTDSPVFEDLQATHPSFPRVSIYRWKNRTLRRVFLKQLHAAEHSDQAAKLIAYLKASLPVTSRGIAKLFLELSRFLPTTREAEFYRDYLAWWIGSDEATLLAEQLSHAVETGRLDPNVLWDIVVGTRHTWPAYRRFAVLEAFAKQKGGVPYELQDSFCDVKARLLCQLARYSEAEEMCRAALTRRERSLGPDHPEVAATLNGLGVVLDCQGKYEEAEALEKRALAILERALGSDHPDVATSLSNLGTLLGHQGRYEEAEALEKRALAIREKLLGPDHPDVADSLNGLAILLDNQGMYEEAEPLCRRTLAIREKVLGADHPDVAATLNGLAMLLQRHGRYEEAEPVYRRALAIEEKVLGPDHPEVAVSLGNLAILLDQQGKYEPGALLQKRALAILERALGSDHPDVARDLNNLATLLIHQGKYEEAEPLQKRALAIQEKVLRADHPNVAMSLNNLATLLDHQGKYEEAEPLHRRALVTQEKVLGPDHPDVALSLNNLAALLYRRGLYEEAGAICRRVLAVRERVLGPDHPDVAGSLRDLATLLDQQGKYEEAEPLHRRALAIREKVLGPDHPDTADSLSSLAGLLDDQGKYEEAEPLCGRALAIREKALGPDHPDVAGSLNGLARLLDQQGKYEEAEPLCRRALAIRENVLGPNHPDVADSLNGLATLLDHQGKYEKAEPPCRRALAIREKVLGADHPDVADSLNNLAMLLDQQGKYEEAEPLYRRALAIREKVLGPDHPYVATTLNNLAALLHKSAMKKTEKTSKTGSMGPQE